MMSSTLNTLAYAEARGVELRRQAARARLAKSAARKTRMTAIGRSPRV